MTDTKTFRKTINRIAAMGGALATLTHETAIAMANHAKEHGDMTLFVDLYNALHTAQRRKAFAVWLHDFTPIRIRVKDDVALAKGSRLLKEDDKGFTAWNIEGLSTVTYWDYTKEASPSYLTSKVLTDMIERMTKRLERAVENETTAPDLDVDAAKAYLATLAKIVAPDMTKAEAAQA